MLFQITPRTTEKEGVATLDFFPLSHDFCTALRNNGLEAVLKQYETCAVQNQMTKFTLKIVRK
jgi:hypothetical protein